MNSTQRVVRGLSSQTIVTLILGILEIVSFAIMSRLLTQEDFGYYAAISSVTAIFIALSETGIGAAVVQRKSLDKTYINNAFTLSFIVGLILFVILFSLSDVLANLILDIKLGLPLRLISVTLITHCLASVNISILQRQLKFITIGLVNIISLVITTIVAIILALNGFGFYAILTKAVLYSVMTWIISWVCCKARYRIECNLVTMKSIVGFSGWLMASALIRDISNYLDRLTMGRILSVSALGAYNRPKEFISQINSKLNGIFDTVLFPILSDIQDDSRAIVNAFMKSLYFMNLFSSMLALAFYINSDLIIRIFFGVEWFNLLIVFKLLSISMIFNINGRLADCYLRSLAMTKNQFCFRILQLLITIMALVIGSHWELVGIAASVVISNLIMVIIKVIFIAQKIGVGVFNGLIRIIESWRILLVMFPILAFTKSLMPDSLVSDLMLLGINVALLILIFICFPSIVGREYRDLLSSVMQRMRYNQ